MTEAVDRSLAQLPWPSLKQRNVLVRDFSVTAIKLDQEYVRGAVEALLNEQGAHVVYEPARADFILTVLTAAVGTDEADKLFGTPRIETVLATLPELALYKAEVQQGFAKISFAIQDARNGNYAYRSEPAQATSYVRTWRILFFSRYETDTTRGEPK